MWLPGTKECLLASSNAPCLRCDAGRRRLRGQLQSWHQERGRSFITIDIFVKILRRVGNSQLDRILANVPDGIFFSNRRDNNEAVVLVDVDLCYSFKEFLWDNETLL